MAAGGVVGTFVTDSWHCLQRYRVKLEVIVSCADDRRVFHAFHFVLYEVASSGIDGSMPVSYTHLTLPTIYSV